MSGEGASNLTLVLTTGCNMRCRYCYQRRGETRTMPWPVVQASIDLALRSGGREPEITFYGGEPLLEFDTIRRAVAHGRSERQARSGRPARVRLRVITNGTLLTPEAEDFLAENSVRLVLSFDGVRAAQEARGAGTFDAVDRALDSLSARHRDYMRRSLEVSVTVPPSSVPFIAESVEYLIARGVQRIHIEPVITACPDWTGDLLPAIEDQFAGVLSTSLRHLESTGEVPVLLYSGSDTAAERPASRPMCGVVDNRSWAVDVDGSVYGCVLFAPSLQELESPMLRSCQSRLRIGHVADDDLPERAAAFSGRSRQVEMLVRKEEKHSSRRQCGECRFLQACHMCPASIGYVGGNADPRRVPDYYCDFNYAALSSRDGFPARPSDAELVRGDRHANQRKRWRRLAQAARRRAPGGGHSLE